uniref:Uncharacterized protein n=1 Tax=Arundo donax TaxID=35708 RepID=A0A0A8XWT3_ARUDO
MPVAAEPAAAEAPPRRRRRTNTKRAPATSRPDNRDLVGEALGGIP